ncbi:MAG: hypothetical protein V4495_29770, partial [Pseudomonadota bacterium]
AFIPHTPAYLVKRGFCFWANENNKQKQTGQQPQDLSTQRHGGAKFQIITTCPTRTAYQPTTPGSSMRWSDGFEANSLVI